MCGALCYLSEYDYAMCDLSVWELFDWGAMCGCVPWGLLWEYG